MASFTRSHSATALRARAGCSARGKAGCWQTGQREWCLNASVTHGRQKKWLHGSDLPSATVSQQIGHRSSFAKTRSSPTKYPGNSCGDNLSLALFISSSLPPSSFLPLPLPSSLSNELDDDISPTVIQNHSTRISFFSKKSGDF
ncbi:MAG: hypothetical protein Q8P67_25765 [archaeon]|nr:hypothetical protein [archaeon]